MQKTLAAIVALASLATCLFFAVEVFLGRMEMDRFKMLFLVSSVLWFVAATFWLGRKEQPADDSSSG